MKQCKVRISESDIRRIIIQEMQQLHEDVDHEGIANVASVASKMLKAANEFRQNANPSMSETVSPYFERVIELLEEMVSNPGAYIVKPKLEPKKVTLAQVKPEE